MASTLRLPRDLDERLAAHCRRHGATKAGVTRVALDRYLAREGNTPEPTPEPNGWPQGATRLVENLALIGLDAGMIAAETGLDEETVAALLDDQAAA